MPDIKKDSTSSPQQPSNQRRSEEAAVNERLEKDADEMAGGSENREKIRPRARYFHQVIAGCPRFASFFDANLGQPAPMRLPGRVPHPNVVLFDVSMGL